MFEEEVHVLKSKVVNGECRVQILALYQYAEYGKCTHEPFLKKLIAHTKIVALHAAALIGLRDLHLTFN